MIIWSGFGIIVPAVALGAMVIAQLLTDAVLGKDYYTRHTWPKLATCIFSGLVLWFVGRWMNKPGTDGFINEELRAAFQSRPTHSFFFVPVQYWGFVVVALGLYLTFM